MMLFYVFIQGRKRKKDQAFFHTVDKRSKLPFSWQFPQRNLGFYICVSVPEDSCAFIQKLGGQGAIRNSGIRSFQRIRNCLFQSFSALLVTERIPHWQIGGKRPVQICHLTGCDSIGYLVNDNAARKCLWEESQTLICFWSYAGLLAALWALGNLKMQSIAFF